ncbi:c-type cytochrome [Paracoccus haematequi]|uniref:c-type cytochrome n=1 Tax=Paracoccus haematequi TaxID=2491866 RepID=UPI001F49F694|nr:cytochrome c [Paracoccus haematequi]
MGTARTEVQGGVPTTAFKVDLCANGHNLTRMRRSYLPAIPKWAICLLVVGFATGGGWVVWGYGKTVDLQRGAQLYSEHCAVCHGAQLEGQPDWQIADENGILPAPPHDRYGHTWHHDDAMLEDYIRRGGQAVIDDMGVSMTSGMPAFGSSLSDDEIGTILAFIKSTWPKRIQAIQASKNDG